MGFVAAVALAFALAALALIVWVLLPMMREIRDRMPEGRGSNLAGNWGEAGLRSLLQTTPGLVEGRHWDWKPTDLPGGDKKPDCRLWLPDGGAAYIDAKMIAPDRLRREIRDLGNRHYQDDSSLPFVIAYIGSEAAYVTAVKKWPDLPTFAHECGVLLITPHSAPLALAVLAFLWREKTEREEAEAIRGLNEEAGKALVNWLARRRQSTKALRGFVAAFNEERDAGTGAREAAVRIAEIRGTSPPPELGTVGGPKDGD